MDPGVRRDDGGEATTTLVSILICATARQWIPAFAEMTVV
jgi:hypothetical protein